MNHLNVFSDERDLTWCWRNYPVLARSQVERRIQAEEFRRVLLDEPMNALKGPER